MPRRSAWGPRQAIKVRERRRKVEAYLLRGITNQTRIAAALGVTQPTISSDIRAIVENWHVADPATARGQRQLRIKQLQRILLTALNDCRRPFRRSGYNGDSRPTRGFDSRRAE